MLNDYNITLSYVVMSFSNKVVIVTGAGSGIGAATAELFAKEGANVVIVDINEENLKRSVTQCSVHGITPLVIKADVGEDNDAKRIIKETIDKFGKLDVLVNNAGISSSGSVLNEQVMIVFDEIMKTNFRAIVHLTSLAAPYLIESKGSVVNVSSIAGKKVIGSLQITIYGAFKAALDQYSRSTALEFAPHGVRMNVVSPGPVWTDIVKKSEQPVTREDLRKMTPLARVIDPDEIGNIILFLSSDKANGITGSDFIADCGMMLR